MKPHTRVQSTWARWLQTVAQATFIWLCFQLLALSAAAQDAVILTGDFEHPFRYLDHIFVTATPVLCPAAFNSPRSPSLSNMIARGPNAVELALNRYAGVTVFGVPGTTYQIQSSPVVTGGIWSPVATVVLTNTSQLWVDTSGPAGCSNRFYRALLVTPAAKN